MIKAAAGGGGIGMSAAADPAQLTAGFETASVRRAERFFGSPAILLERYVERGQARRGADPRAWPTGGSSRWASATARCSAGTRRWPRRRPSPGVSPQLRARMLAAAVQAGEAVGYRGAGTVECLVDVAAQEFVFLEMNTRLQVEHPVTELVTGIDLVEQQFLIAAGEDVSFDRAGRFAVTVMRSNCGSMPRTRKRFLPSPGMITRVGGAVGARSPGRRRLRGGQHGDAVLRPAAGQAVRARRRPGAGAGPGRGRGRRVRDQRAEDESAVPRRPAGIGGVPQRRLRHVRGEPAAPVTAAAAAVMIVAAGHG